MSRIVGLFVALFCAVMGTRAIAQSAEEVSEANNPLTPKVTLNLQDQWAPQLYDSGDYTNFVLLRGVLPHKLFGEPQMFRFAMPIPTVPDDSNGGTTIGREQHFLSRPAEPL